MKDPRIVDKMHEVLRSEDYLEQLQRIHRHYPNLKSESRYRDAFLEEFNERWSGEGLRAYAEVNKMDLVIVAEANRAKACWINVQFKYQYTYDMAKRVGNRLASENLWQRVHERKRGDAELIAADCIILDSGRKKTCDVFILIVQDRRGHDDRLRYLPDGTDPKEGVKINFIDEQVKLDGEFNARDAYHEAWRAPTLELLQQIVEKSKDYRHGRLNGQFELSVSDAPPAPLKSHFFVVDFLGA
uniref:hypothetical protein n=1 Tax=Cupriavidus necator TaxID=106590 RepID=UPI003F4924B1